MNQNHLPESINLAINKLRAAHLFWLLIINLVGAITAWNFFSGFLILVLRQLRFSDINYLGIGTTGLFVCLLIAGQISLKKQMPVEKALAFIDGHNQSGGLIIATAETGDHSWVSRLPKLPEVPGLRARLNRRLPAMVFSILFLLAGITIPILEFTRKNDPGMDLKGLEEKALLQIETLEETEIISETEAEELKETVGQMVKSADKNDPSKTFEAFDQLEEKIRKEGGAAAQNAMSQLEELEKLKNLAEKVQKHDLSDTEGLKNALSDLQNSFSTSKTAQKMSSENKNSLQKALESVDKEGNPSSEEIAKATEQLKNYIQNEVKRMNQMAQKLQKAMIIDQKTFEKLKKEGKIRPLKDGETPQNSQKLILAPQQDGKSGEGSTMGQGTESNAGSQSEGGEKAGNQNGSKVGAGGVSRGPGTAPLNYNRKSSEHNIGFRDEQLPQPGLNSLEDSVVIGIGESAPLIETQDPISADEMDVNVESPEEGSGKSELILPRHRSAVKNFFERK
jgi:uncharacterized protein YutE (UPF0331/DUF86 family)